MQETHLKIQILRQEDGQEVQMQFFRSLIDACKTKKSSGLL